MINCVNILLLCLFNINPSMELQICLIDIDGIEHPWIYGYDILSYDWDNHTVYIVPDSIEKVVSRDIPCSGFSVKIGGTTLYSGVSHFSYDSSFDHKSPAILVWMDGLPSIDLKCNCFSIYYLGEEEDRRSNPSLYFFLKRENKLIERP